MNPQPKPGYLTTEFWITIITTIFSLLVTATIISTAQSDQYLALIIPLITAVLPTITYIHSRGKVKASMPPHAIEPATPDTPPAPINQ